MPVNATRTLFMARGNSEPLQTPSPVPCRGGRKAVGFLPYPPRSLPCPPSTAPSNNICLHSARFSVQEEVSSQQATIRGLSAAAGLFAVPQLAASPTAHPNTPSDAEREGMQFNRLVHRARGGAERASPGEGCQNPPSLRHSPAPTEHPRQPQLLPGSAPSLEV